MRRFCSAQASGVAGMSDSSTVLSARGGVRVAF